MTERTRYWLIMLAFGIQFLVAIANLLHVLGLF